MIALKTHPSPHLIPPSGDVGVAKKSERREEIVKLGVKAIEHL